MDTITKKMLVDLVAKSMSMQPNFVRLVFQACLDQILRELSEGKRLEFRDFGVFQVVWCRTKKGFNAKENNSSYSTHFPMIKFTPSKLLKKTMKDQLKPFSSFKGEEV